MLSEACLCAGKGNHSIKSTCLSGILELITGGEQTLSGGDEEVRSNPPSSSASAGTQSSSPHPLVRHSNIKQSKMPSTQVIREELASTSGARGATLRLPDKNMHALSAKPSASNTPSLNNSLIAQLVGATNCSTLARYLRTSELACFVMISTSHSIAFVCILDLQEKQLIWISSVCVLPPSPP